MRTALLALALTGCATSFSALEPKLTALRGKPVDEAIVALGIPTREYQVAGRTAYEWTTSTPNPFASNNPPLTCTVKALASDGVVLATEYAGSNGACFAFVRR